MAVTQSWVPVLAAEVGLATPRAYTVPWERVERELGLVLPTDYKEFVYWFGPGNFDDFLFVAVPGIANPHLELAHWADNRRESHRYLIEEERIVEEGLAQWPYPLYPAPGSLLSWGVTANGDSMHWDTSGDPDDWTVVVEDNGSFDLFPFSGTMSEFLTRFVRDEMRIPCLPPSEDEPPAVFNPGDGSWEGADALEMYGAIPG